MPQKDLHLYPRPKIYMIEPKEKAIFTPPIGMNFYPTIGIQV
jgi:hypothetical protein